MEKFKQFNINWTYVIVAAILSLGVIGFGLLSFISKEKDRELQRNRIAIEETTKLAEEENREKSLEQCLERAQKEFDDLLTLNSYPDPQPYYPDARRWKSSELEERYSARFNESTELCQKLYSKQ